MLPIRINDKSNQFDPKGVVINISVENKFYKWEISLVSAFILKLTLLKELRKSEVHVFEKTEEFEYGKFGWLLDPEGNKIELWEPVDEKFVF